jgi:hypothetical protein
MVALKGTWQVDSLARVKKSGKSVNGIIASGTVISQEIILRKQ